MRTLVAKVPINRRKSTVPLIITGFLPKPSKSVNRRLALSRNARSFGSGVAEGRLGAASNQHRRGRSVPQQRVDVQLLIAVFGDGFFLLRWQQIICGRWGRLYPRKHPVLNQLI